MLRFVFRLPRLGAYVHFLYDFAWEQNQLPNTTEGFILTTFEVLCALWCVCVCVLCVCVCVCAH